MFDLISQVQSSMQSDIWNSRFPGAVLIGLRPEQCVNEATGATHSYRLCFISSFSGGTESGTVWNWCIPPLLNASGQIVIAIRAFLELLQMENIPSHEKKGLYSPSSLSQKLSICSLWAQSLVYLLLFHSCESNFSSNFYHWKTLFLFWDCLSEAFVIPHITGALWNQLQSND